VFTSSRLTFIFLITQAIQQVVTMKEPIYRKFLKMAKIFLHHSQIFGLAPFGFNETNFHSSRPKLIYNMSLMVAYLVLFGYCVCAIPTLAFLPNKYITTITVINVADAVYISTILICSLVKRNKLMKLLGKIIEFDVTLQTKCVIVDYQKGKKRMISKLVGRYIYLGTHFFLSFYLSPWTDVPRNKFFQLSGLTLILLNSAMCYQVTELVLILKRRFAILNRQLKNLAKYSKKNGVNTVCGDANNEKMIFFFGKICSLHHLLSKSTKLFNNIFGLSLLLMFGVTFIITVISSFYSTVELQQKKINWMSLFYTFLPSANFVFDALYVCQVCYSTVEEVKL
jgi:hypothetical protein